LTDFISEFSICKYFDWLTNLIGLFIFKPIKMGKTKHNKVLYNSTLASNNLYEVDDHNNTSMFSKIDFSHLIPIISTYGELFRAISKMIIAISSMIVVDFMLRWCFNLPEQSNLSTEERLGRLNFSTYMFEVFKLIFILVVIVWSIIKIFHAVLACVSILYALYRLLKERVVGDLKKHE